MNVQVSRGCPFSCDFCEIITLLGHKVRLKNTDQIIRELDILYNLNWRGPVVIVDDNDTPVVFQRQIDFIQQSGIVSAMVGLLNAPKNTRLYKRLLFV